MEVYTSMRPDEILAEAGTSRGVVSLKQFLHYAETGILPDYGHVTGRPPDSEFEISVAKLLRQFGWNVEHQVGVAGFFIDLAVMNPNRKGEYLLGIECDGANYHSGRSARDRDRLREDILRLRGWDLYRIWSTDWFKNRNSEIERLTAYVNQCFERVKLRPVTESELFIDIVKPADVGESVEVLGDEALSQRLITFGSEYIGESAFKEPNGLLRPALLQVLVHKRPIDKEAFRNMIPYEIRTHIDLEQGQYLDDILEIIETASE